MGRRVSHVVGGGGGLYVREGAGFLQGVGI